MPMAEIGTPELQVKRQIEFRVIPEKSPNKLEISIYTEAGINLTEGVVLTD